MSMIIVRRDIDCEGDVQPADGRLKSPACSSKGIQAPSACHGHQGPADVDQDPLCVLSALGEVHM